MYNKFRKHLEEIFEAYGYRNGFAGGRDELPVIGMDYNEDPVSAPSPETEPGENVPDQTQINEIITDLEEMNKDDPNALAKLEQLRSIVEVPSGVEGVEQIEGPDEFNPYTSVQPPSIAREQRDHQEGQADPTKPITTHGETMPYGMERSDEVDYTGLDDSLGEIASLLVTIGHILKKDRIIPNKFEVPMILNYLNHNFSEKTPDQIGNLCEQYIRNKK